MPDPPSQGTSPRLTVFNAALASITAIAVVVIPLVWNNRNTKIEDDRQKIERLNTDVASAKNRIADLEKQNADIRRELLQRPLTSRPSPREPADNDIAIHFTEPRNRDSVQHIIDVEFTIIGRIPTGYQPVLLIKDPRGKYWSWGAVPSRRMRNVTLGLDTEHKELFEIGVLITDEVPPGNTPFDRLPRNLSYSSINVTRQ